VARVDGVDSLLNDVDELLSVSHADHDAGG
jgi:hypothetical protein